jgi:hypothetical protein
MSVRSVISNPFYARFIPKGTAGRRNFWTGLTDSPTLGVDFLKIPCPPFKKDGDMPVLAYPHLFILII